jgi:hypothetical protein
MYRILKHALATAVRWRMLTRNPVDSVDPPKVERRKMTALDATEIARCSPISGTPACSSQSCSR